MIDHGKREKNSMEINFGGEKMMNCWHLCNQDVFPDRSLVEWNSVGGGEVKEAYFLAFKKPTY